MDETFEEAKDRKGMPAVLFGALGFGVFGAWGFVVESNAALSGSDGVAGPWLWPSTAAYAAVLLAFAFAYRASERTLPFRALSIACGVVGLAGAVLVAVAGMAPGSAPAIVGFAAVLTGIARGVSGLLLLVLFSRLKERDLVGLFGISSIVTSGISLAVHAVPGVPLSLFALAALPVACSLLLLKCRVAFEDVQDPAPLDEGSVAWSFPVKPVGMLVAYTFVVHLGAGLMPALEFAAAPLGNIAAGVLLLASTTLFWSRFQVGTVYRVSLPIVLASILLCLFPEQPAVSFGVGFFGGLGFAGFLAFANVVLCVICHRYGVNPVWLFGITMAVRIPAKLAADEITGLAAVDAGLVVPVVVVAALVLVSLSMACASGDDYESSWGMQPLASGQANAETPYKAFLNRCAELARAYNLTHREEEVLTLLAQGMNVPAVESALVISKSTAKSHVRNLYGKLGVHSRDELLDMVGREHVLIAERYRGGLEGQEEEGQGPRG